MGADFYTEDYLYGGGGGDGGYYDGGGGDIGAGGDFNYGYGTEGGLPPDYAPVADQAWMIDPSSGFMDLGGGYLYDPSTGGILDTGLWAGFDQSQAGGDDLWRTSYENWLGVGLDEATAAQRADADVEAIRASQDVINISQSATELNAPPPTLPDVNFPYFPLPVGPYDYWQSPPYVPSFPDLPAPQPPSPPLPGYCPRGTYHPIGDPYSCAPFPEATTNQQQQRPPGQQPAPSAPRPPTQQQRPPQQQACPSGHDTAATGQRRPIPRCVPPMVVDQRSGRCVPAAQAQAPGCPTGYVFDPATGQCVQASQLPPSEAGDLLSNLKNVPWWIWAALGGLFLLSRDESRTTTVRYKKSS